VTDRTVLDKQLQDAIAQIEHQTGVVKAIDSDGSGLPKSQQLAQAMLEGTPIIVCTLQTFPFAQKAILTEKSLRERRFAVVIDEAHSSTSGSTADDLRYVLTGQSEEEWEQLSARERLSVWQASRSRPGNASYFAFTATPKHSTLSLFGRPRDRSRPVADDIVGAMTSHQTLATRLLSDDEARQAFLDVVYELLTQERAGGLPQAARPTAR